MSHSFAFVNGDMSACNAAPDVINKCLIFPKTKTIQNNLFLLTDLEN